MSDLEHYGFLDPSFIMSLSLYIEILRTKLGNFTILLCLKYVCIILCKSFKTLGLVFILSVSIIMRKIINHPINYDFRIFTTNSACFRFNIYNGLGNFSPTPFIPGLWSILSYAAPESRSYSIFA